MGWLWWVGGALALGVLEMLSLDLVLVMFAGGALAGAVASAIGWPVWAQVIVAAATSVVLLGSLRPWLLRRWRQRTPLVETNSAALVGRPAVVVSTVDATGGRIKLVGEVWSARTETGTRLEPGEAVTVSRIDGATAVVRPGAPVG